LGRQEEIEEEKNERKLRRCSNEHWPRRKKRRVDNVSVGFFFASWNFAVVGSSAF